jgi:hypothetical protein
MRPNKSFTLASLAVAVAVLLAACGGAGSSGTGTGTGTNGVTIVDSFGRTVFSGSSGQSSDGFGAGDSGADGSAGDGLPIVGGSLILTDATGVTTTPVITDAKGYFRVKVTGLTPPFVAKVTRPDGIVRYSLNVTPVKNNGFITINISGLTTKIAADVAAAAGTTLANLTPANVNAHSGVITTSIASMRTTLASVIQSAGLSTSTFDPLTVAFVPNYTGYDFVLDNSVVPASNPLSVSVLPTFVPSTVTQTAGLAQAVSDVQSLLASMTAAYASAPSATQLQNYLDSTYLNNGATGAANGGTKFASFPVGSEFSFAGVAPYPGGASSTGTPVAGNAVVYDANNCVTSMWVNLAFNGLVSENTLVKHNVTSPGVCSSGTWTLAGNQRQHESRISTFLTKIVSASGTIKRSSLHLSTESADTGYSTVEISGPGITTLAAPNATTAGTVTLIHASALINLFNLINDPYYGSTSNNPYYSGQLEGSADIQDCAAMTIGTAGNGAAWGVAPTGATPCINLSQVVAGSDYTIKFKDSNGAVIETDQQRLQVAPYALPDSLYPVVTSVTPAGNTITSAGGTETLNWTLPSGAKSVMVFVNVNDANITTLKNASKYVGANTTSASLVVPALPGSVGGGNNGLPTTNSSYAFIVAAVGGILVQSAVNY